MGNYVKKFNTIHPRDKDIHALLQRLVRNTNQPQQTNVQIDASQIANVVAQVVSGVVENNLKNVQQNVPKQVYNLESGSSDTETYDESKSLAKLAESMLVQRGNSQSNFEDLGGVNTTKKDSKETQSTIDLLKNLDD